MALNSKDSPGVLPEAASLLLDVVRFSAALMVVIDHFTLPEFGLHYLGLRWFGDVAVPLFFVLSGFVIRYVTRTRESTLREYFIDRASRIYSVVLPAMGVTLAISGICYLLDPATFVQHWSQLFTQPLLRFLLNLTFVSQAWGHNTIPFLDIPFWSLGYECIYYVLYGFAFYRRGWVRALCWVLVAVGIGPQVMFLLPIWWLGCWVADVYFRVQGTAWARGLLAAAGVWLLVAGMVWGFGYSGVLHAPVRAFWWVAGLPNPLSWAGQPYERATMFAVATGVFGSGVLFVLLLASDMVRLSRNSWGARGFRQVANGTFTIYLMHYPMLVLLLFLGWLRRGHDVANVAAVAAVCVVLTAAAVPVDWLKVQLRRWLRERFPATDE